MLAEGARGGVRSHVPLCPACDGAAFWRMACARPGEGDGDRPILAGDIHVGLSPFPTLVSPHFGLTGGESEPPETPL